MPFPNKMEKETNEAFANPQIGDRFTEMYCFWMYVIARRDDKVITMEASSPCTFPDDGKMNVYSLEDFQKRFSYGSTSGYWVSFVDHNNNVEGWLEEGIWNENSRT
ncbi:MAG: hypothetical protein WDA59_01805 [Methanofastidiosum sp.]